MDREELRQFALGVLPEVESILARTRDAEESGMSSAPRPSAVGCVIGARAALEVAKKYLDDAVRQP